MGPSGTSRPRPSAPAHRGRRGGGPAREAPRPAARARAADRRAAGEARRRRLARPPRRRAPSGRHHRARHARRGPRREGYGRDARSRARPHRVGRGRARRGRRGARAPGGRGHEGPHRPLPRRPDHQAARAAGGRPGRRAARLRAGRRKGSRPARRGARRCLRAARRREPLSALAETAPAPAELRFADARLFRELLGQHDEYVKALERQVGVRIDVADSTLTLHGDPLETELVSRVLLQLYGLLESGYPIYASDVDYALRILSSDRNAKLRDIFLDTVFISAHKRVITPKSVAQKEYIDAIRNFDIVFGIGPAGTGKTYLAMAMAVAELMKNSFTRIILTRPAVEAGEKLGFLPGDLAEKVNPYLRPLYDALHDMVDFDRARRMVERGTIEVAPLGFMRGRTLNDSFVILDEAQNTTTEQMKMFLTRLGYGSKAVVTGDVTQIDLPAGKASGLKEAAAILRGIPGIRFITFTERDVVRHPLVQEIITAYDRAER